MGTVSAGTPTGIAGALRSLDQAVEAPPQPDAPLHWWGVVRQRLTGLHDALVSETVARYVAFVALPRSRVIALQAPSTFTSADCGAPPVWK